MVGTVAVITFDDGKVNALSRRAVDLLSQALERVTADDEVEAVVLTGRAGQFSAGFDLDTLMIGGPERRELFQSGWKMLEHYLTLPLPLVVACTGNAIAAGAILLLAGDIRLAATGDFAIGFNEARIGLPLPSLLLVLARERLDPAAFDEATAGARLYAPRDAAEVGYVDRVVAPSDLLTTALAEARRLAGLPRDQFLDAKEVQVAERGEQVRTHLQADLDLMASLGD